MKTIHVLSSLVAGSLIGLGGLGCSHSEPAPATPSTYNGSTTASPNADGTMTPDQNQNQTPGMGAPTAPGDQRQNVNGVDRDNNSLNNGVHPGTPVDPANPSPPIDGSGTNIPPPSTTPSPTPASPTGGSGVK